MGAHTVPKRGIAGDTHTQRQYRYAAWGTHATYSTAWCARKEPYSRANICVGLDAVRVARTAPGYWCTDLSLFLTLVDHEFHDHAFVLPNYKEVYGTATWPHQSQVRTCSAMCVGARVL